MKTWIVEPHDSFIPRDGRPFGLLAGVRATSLPFPFPSTTTGGVRTREGLDAEGVFDNSKPNIERVKNIEVRGALLAEIDNARRVCHWYAPTPADALLLDADDKDNNKAKVCRLIPRGVAAGTTNIPDGLLPLFLESKNKGKPHAYAPRFWKWKHFTDWLAKPGDFTIEDLYNFGIRSLPQDERVHVAIDSATQTSDPSQLFQTRGLELTRQRLQNDLRTAARLALCVHTDATNVKIGVSSLGGERRLVSWHQFEGEANVFTSHCPERITDDIIESKAGRIILLTPAYFEAGWRPSWLLKQGNLTLRAAAVNRAQVISGWDLEIGKPKPTRRLVPAGSVFFFKIQADDETTIRNWINATWMRCISDDDPKGMTRRKDGFGVAVLGTWNEGKDLT